MSLIVTLRPVAAEDLPLHERLRTDPAEASEFGFYGHRTTHALRRGFAENGLLDEAGGTLTVLAGQEAVGAVSWHRVVTAPSSFTWNIGVALLREGRGKGYGTAAQRALAAYLFGYTQAYRVEACTESTNVAEQRALEKAGFGYEGVSRGAAFRGGVWRDMVVYALVRTDCTAEELG